MNRLFQRVLLPVAAVVIVALCTWRLLIPREPDPGTFSDQWQQPAPTFVLHDQNSKRVNLDSFLHRHDIILAFFDAATGPDGDEAIQLLAAASAELKREGVIVLGISTALPQENRRRAGEDFPLPLLSDVNPQAPDSTIRVWGRHSTVLDGRTAVIPGVFHIDRTGLVDWQDQFPRPVNDLDALIRSF